jgi:hypothetical protein
MNTYNTLTRKYTDFAKQGIFSLNMFILDHIRRHYSIPNIREFYHKISEEILSLCWNINAIIKSSIWMEEAELEEAKEKRRNIVRQIINFEKQHSKGYAILYRGAIMHYDSLIDDYKRGRSLSFNASILSGCVLDNTACTLSYLTPSSSGLYLVPNNDNIKCSLKKFLLHDSSDEDSLFFIPPIHPFLQVYCRGELFHPRTKLGSNFKSFSSIWGLNCKAEQFEYLISDKSFEQLNALYQHYKSSDVISIWSSHSDAAIFQEAARIGASLPRLLQKMKQKEEEQKATRLSLENAARMGQMNKMNPNRAKYYTKLGFGGRKSHKKSDKVCRVHVTNSNKNKNKKKYKKNNKTLKYRCR